MDTKLPNETPEAIASNGSRRRFVRGASILAPTILTVGARSTLAATCLSPSATASNQLLNSRPGRPGDGLCAGRSPGYWKNVRSNDLSRQTQFSQVFPGAFAGKTMHEVVALTGNSNFESLARHLAAAWLNLQSGLVPPEILSLPQLQAMWAGRNGSYTPVVGGNVFWGEGKIVEYLKTTMI